jgi:hypothetical protein
MLQVGVLAPVIVPIVKVRVTPDITDPLGMESVLRSNTAYPLLAALVTDKSPLVAPEVVAHPVAVGLMVRLVVAPCDMPILTIKTRISSLSFIILNVFIQLINSKLNIRKNTPNAIKTNSKI